MKKLILNGFILSIISLFPHICYTAIHLYSNSFGYQMHLGGLGLILGILLLLIPLPLPIISIPMIFTGLLKAQEKINLKESALAIMGITLSIIALSSTLIFFRYFYYSV